MARGREGVREEMSTPSAGAQHTVPGWPGYLRDGGVAGGGFLHHPLCKELFEPQVILQDHLEQRALGEGEG